MTITKERVESGPGYIGNCIWEFALDDGTFRYVEAPDAGCAWAEFGAGHWRNADGSKTIPKYQSHKVVHALKIAALEIHRDKSATIVPEDRTYEIFKTREGWADRFGNNDDDPGYYVVYGDGFTSWSPTKTFEDNHTRIEE